MKPSKQGHVVRSPTGEALCHSVTRALGAVDPWIRDLGTGWYKNYIKLLDSVFGLAFWLIAFHHPRSSSLQVSQEPAPKICLICEPRQKEAWRFVF